VGYYDMDSTVKVVDAVEPDEGKKVLVFPQKA
jgi:hypothetical protein